MSNHSREQSTLLAKDELAQLSDEEILALAEAFGEQPEKQPKANIGEPARRGLDLVRFAIANLPPVRSDIETAAAISSDTNPIGSANSSHKPLRLPKRIGRFDIVREIGQGGFGIVLLALDPVLNRLVALKIPKPQSLVSRDARTRFEREARAAAMLSHPGIVPLHETDLDGPIQYIAFGYVPGESLAALIARRGVLPCRLAAQIVARLAEPVGHAHQRGVVHRDLKPANVLLSSLPGERKSDDQELADSLRIADFGLAKFADPASTGLTREGALLGTPSYMSPEQAIGRDDQIGPAVDIYGLGAILYELLTGRPPFREESDIATLKAVESRPPKLPRMLNARVPRDLEAICLKCLEKSPQQRYTHAAELGADLQRWLAGEPVVARPVTAVVRLNRWCLRNPALAVALAVAFLSLGVGLGVALLQQQRLRDQLQTITAEKMRADQQTDRAMKSETAALNALGETRAQRTIAERHSAISNVVREFFYVDLLGQSEPEFQFASLNRLRGMGLEEFEFAANPTLKDLLRRVLPRLSDDQLGARFAGQPIVQAELLTNVGKVLLDQGMHHEALPLLERARTLYPADETDAPGISTSRIKCEFQLARALSAVGRTDEAERLHREVLKQGEALDSGSEENLESRYVLAKMEFERGNSAEATALYRAILDLAIQHFEPDAPQRRRAINKLAYHLISSQQSQQAVQLLLEHFPDLESARNRHDSGELDSESLLARSLFEIGQSRRAIPLLEDNYETRSSFQGAEYPATFRSKLLLAGGLFQSGEDVRAIGIHRQILDSAGKLFDEDSNVMLDTMNNLATIHWKRGELDQSIPLFERACELAKKRYGPDNVNTLSYLLNLAVNYRDAGRFAEAVPLLQSVCEHSPGFGPLQWAREALVNAWLKTSQLEPAEIFCRKWIEMLDGPEPPPVAQQFESHCSLGRVLRAKDQFADAEKELRLALELGRGGKVPLADTYWPLDRARAELGYCLWKQGNTAAAIDSLEQGCAGLIKQFSKIPHSCRADIFAYIGYLIELYELKSDTEKAGSWRSKLEQVHNNSAEPGK